MSKHHPEEPEPEPAGKSLIREKNPNKLIQSINRETIRCSCIFIPESGSEIIHPTEYKASVFKSDLNYFKTQTFCKATWPPLPLLPVRLQMAGPVHLWLLMKMKNMEKEAD